MHVCVHTALSLSLCLSGTKGKKARLSWASVSGPSVRPRFRLLHNCPNF